MTAFNLAQLNIGKAKADMDSETMHGFASRLDEINTLAEAAPGFIWRLQTEEGDATSISAFDDPMLIVNMSVWSDIETLKHYVYKSQHLELLKEKKAWFHKMKVSHQVLWWVPDGHHPSIDEGKAKLEYLQAHGPTEKAFTFTQYFDPPKAAIDSVSEQQVHEE